MNVARDHLDQLRRIVGPSRPPDPEPQSLIHYDGRPRTTIADRILRDIERTAIFDDADSGRLVPIWKAFARHQAAEEFADSIKVYQYRDQLAEIRAELELEAEDRARRRRAEHELADYIEATQPDMADKVESMRTCRTAGCVGIRPGGGHVVAWDHKCGDVRLCPDEAREETRRLASKYVPTVQQWVQAKPTRRVFYAVFTFGNFEPGRLAHGKHYLFKRFKAWQDRKRPCTEADRRRWGYGPKKRKVPEFPGLKGSLVIQEDPLSASGEWNVHLNALLLVEGEFDFKRVRDTWGCNVELREIRSDTASLARTMNEIVKYAAAHVGGKSVEKHADGSSQAPPMTGWPGDLWREWFDAQQGFRRTRSYGALYKVPKPDTESLEDVEWVGAIKFTDAGNYWVDLIPGDNFLNRAAAKAARPAPGYKFPDPRPPPPP